MPTGPRVPTEATSTQAGVLRPEELARHIDVKRTPCSSEVSTWVEGYWQLRWSIPPGQSYLSQVLPHPAVSLTIEHGDTRPEIGDAAVLVTGVQTRRFDVPVHGDGTVFGIKFRPGGFTAMFGTPAHTLSDRTIPAAEFLPSQVHDELSSLESTVALSDWTARVDQILTTTLPQQDSSYDLVLDVITRMLNDRTLLRVADVEQRVGVGQRSLQRLFAHYVGVSPKWVLSRYRMHDVITDLDDGYDGLLTDLAVNYGWYDQAHFIRDFTAHIGTTPSDYRNNVMK